MRYSFARVTIALVSFLAIAGLTVPAFSAAAPSVSAEKNFLSPPATARPHVMWMWMGSNITTTGITNDLEKLRDAGFGGTLMFSLADTTTPWPRDILGAPTPEVVAFTRPWWQRVRHAALESKRLGLEFGMSNCPGYSSSGGPWIKPEHAMQMVVWSETRVRGGIGFSGILPRPAPDLVGIQRYPVWNPKTGRLERPEHPERLSFYRDIAVIAVPAKGNIALAQVIELTGRHTPETPIHWEAPPGDWIIYRFGHTVMGVILQPPQFAANGFECDKLSREAVEVHVGHLVSEAQKYVGDLIGTGFHFYHFDSYEADFKRTVADFFAPTTSPSFAKNSTPPRPRLRGRNLPHPSQRFLDDDRRHPPARHPRRHRNVAGHRRPRPLRPPLLPP